MSLAEITKRLVVALESSPYDYALGGALALAYWSEPRATKDIDLTIYVGIDELLPALDVLVAAGLDRPPANAGKAAVEDGLIVMGTQGVRVDVFVPSAPFDFYESARRRRQRVVFGCTQTWVFAAEDLAVFKMLFDRPKDHEDVRRMHAHLGVRFDLGYVQTWLAHLAGPDDPRLATLAHVTNTE